MKLGFCAVAVVCAGLSFGQIAARNHRVWSTAFLRMTFPEVRLKSGEKVLTYEFVVANDYREEPRNFSPVVTEDWESQRLNLTYRTPEYFVSGGVAARNGGALDGLIDWWHQIAFSYKTLRDFSPHGRVRIETPNQRSLGSAIGLTDITVGREFHERAGTTTVAVKLPLGNPNSALGSGNVDIGASFARSWQDGLWGFHAMTGLVWQGRPKTLRHARTWIPQQQLGVSYMITPAKRVSLQWQSEPAALKTGAASADTMHNSLVFGLRQAYQNETILDLYLIEDGDFLFYHRAPSIASLGADFSLGARWTVRF